MNTITVTYALKWRLDFALHICFTDKAREAFNIRTGRKIKRCLNGRSTGYWIGREFYTLTHLRQHLQKIPASEPMPF